MTKYIHKAAAKAIRLAGTRNPIRTENELGVQVRYCSDFK
ncbi:hypothetical protein FACS189499_10470 [Clostridia bacterium]|nr:hypothetical protein FACS189499_10470 [Clostridia bacterium]